MIDLNKFYEQWCKDPEEAKFDLVKTAARELFICVQEKYYTYKDLERLNYCEVCQMCGFPDFQDHGIFERAIEIAANTVLGVMGYAPAHKTDL